ncbi:fibronectin type III domain-containing protein [Parablautia muri]|uniref:Fibronectin type III domain protein n=1 Tax=Parablautia muri TaxID=2320879 RepID=A0A9X5BI29_9FIRM|nr:M60 family metallopeptidase [Parablautia muri]NBJ94153.1 hypothetical protein [Parablautia muri]
MKRMITWMMVFCLIATWVLPVQAAEVNGNGLSSPAPENADVDGMNGNGGNLNQPGNVDNQPKNQVQPLSETSASPSQTKTPGVSAEVSAAPERTPETVPSESPAKLPAESPGESPSVSPTGIEQTPFEASKSPTQSPSVLPSETPAGTPSASPSASATPLATPELPSNGSWNERQVSSGVTGGVEVILMNALPIHKDSKITLVVSLENKESKEIILTNNAEKHTVLFEELPEGTYHLRISEKNTGSAGFGFIPYEQDIAVGKVTEVAEVYTGFVELEGVQYVQGAPHPGVMLIGDVNRDGRLDDGDKNAIMEVISQGSNGVWKGNPEENPTDLNKDGQTDLVDLQYYANSKERMDENADTTASLYSRISSNAVQVNPGTNTQIVEGDPGNLFRDGSGGVTLKAQGTESAIAEGTPVEIGFNLESDMWQSQQVEEIRFAMGENPIESGSLLVIKEDGKEISFNIDRGEARQVEGSGGFSLYAGQGEQNGVLIIDLRGETAVKKVTLKITGMKFGGNLAKISKVEFLNNTENKIPAPDMNIPSGLIGKGGNKSIHVTWNEQPNVTGYEVKICYQGQEQVIRAASNQLEIKSFLGGRLKNGEIYEVSVQSINGTWASGYCEPVQISPAISSRPDAPDNLKAVGGYCRISLTWKNMEDTDSYNVYYKAEGESAYTQITGIDQNRHVLNDLKDETRYEIYVTGVNELGESNPSIHSEARTLSIKPAQMPNYKLINESNGKGKVSAHIKGVTHGRGSMEGSSLDTDKTSALGTVDKDAASYYQVMDWDDGASYPAASKGLLFTLDDYYEMSYITFAEVEDIGWYSGAYVYYYDEAHQSDGVAAQNVSLLQKTDENGRKYYMIKLAQPIKANQIRLGFTRGNNQRNIIISEVNFYYYDSLEDDILALYADDLHTTLKPDVTEETILALQKRLDTKDAKSGEYHPERTTLQRELDNARGLLSSDFQDVVEINPGITAAKDGHLGFSGLNAWQPLGITAYEGEHIVVYVGHNQLKTGSDSALKLIATQYHAESGAFASNVAALKVGRNEITIPAIQSLACEGGGALYIQYTGNNENDRYAVRVSGGAKEPVLNLYGITDSVQRKERITAYLEELDEHVASLEENHKKIHETAGEGNKVNRSYEETNCILGATDIMLDQMMLSVSGKQILAGLGKGTLSERADKLDQSLQAMEDMLKLFYQHKGLSNDAGAPASDHLPAQHLNIRYMRMFAKAFMYAAGNHIGIEWGSVPGLASAVPVSSDENGKYLSGNYFGWGISHEIGHNINQGSYAIAEVTNNYFAQLTKSRDSNDTVRFKYNEVYKKVTSNTVGIPSNVFTHLAMYWQLHLAYDRDYNYKTYDSYEQQQANLFYARVDSYSRDTSRAKGGLKLDGDKNQNIMRLACAAAEKDLTEFFMRWGLVPDSETIRYAGQFEKEERAIYYLTDDARVYEIEHGTDRTINGRDIVSSDSKAAVSKNVANEVTISIQTTADPELILGYEIARYSYENGEPVRQVVGFSTENTYVDHVATINNRALTYEITAVDQFGYRSKARKIGDVRISHDGSQDKSMWNITTNMLSNGDKTNEAVEDDPCTPETVSDIYKVIDNDYNKDYEGQTAGGDAEIVIQMNRILEVCGLKITSKSSSPIGNYTIEVSLDGTSWTTVKTGSFENKSGSQTVYFENADKDPWVCTYDAAYVRLRAKGQMQMSLAEVDLLGPSGDSISFGVRENSTEGAVGILNADYIYEAGKKIPKGSLIFTGSYKGNPAYNVVIIYDEDGNVVGGVDEQNVLKAEQIILADVPENGMLGEVSDGIWIYWIEPELIPDGLKGKKVRAQLYRVDHALTNEGQRLVSDTLPLQVPNTLENITLQNGTKDDTSTKGVTSTPLN